MRNRKHHTSAIFFASLGIAGALLCSVPRQCAAQDINGGFDENFQRRDSLWDVKLEEAVYRYSSNGLLLEGRGRGCPVFLTRGNIFEDKSKWTFAVKFCYLNVGNFGSGICCGTNPEGYDNVIKIHQDSNGMFLRLGEHVVWKVAGNREVHEIYVSRDGDTLKGYVDGKAVGSSVCRIQPEHIRVGGGLVAFPGDWSNLDVREVRLEEGASIHEY